jgi:hypothetical protein
MFNIEELGKHVPDEEQVLMPLLHMANDISVLS